MAQRHAVWKELLGIYMPWMRLDGDIPFYADGHTDAIGTRSLFIHAAKACPAS